MALILANRVQESATANTTVSFTLTGAIQGFQSFSAIGNGNTTYYSATDGSGNWEVGLGTYSTTGPTLTRTTVYASSNSGSPVTFSGAVNVFVTYPSGRSVNLNETGNVSALGTVSSGVWQGTTVGVAYGGTGVTTSSGANSVMLRDANQNVAVNRLNQANTSTTAAGGTTALTAASSYIHTLVGTGGQTYTMPDATTLTTGVAFVFNNMATGTLTLQNFAAGAIGIIPAGGASAVFLTDNSTVGGTWDLHSYLPEGVTFGTNVFNLGTSVISGGTWQGGTIQPGYGGTGLTTFTGANNALYSTGAATLTAGTLPVAAGGTGNTSGQAASVANSVTFNNSGTGDASGTTFNGSAARTISYNTVGAPSTSGANATGTWGINISGNAATATTASNVNNGTLTLAVSGTGLSGSQTFTANQATNATFTVTSNATSANTASTIVARDGSGNFSAGTITATLSGSATSAGSVSNSVTFNNGGAGGASGSTFNGSGALTVSYNTVGAPSTTGTNATGTWGISISGNAATATTASNVNNGTLTLAVSGTGLSGSQTFTANQASNATFTVTSNATNANTASTIVARDASGNFSAGTITAALSGNASTATSATTATNIAGGAANRIPYNTAAATTAFIAAPTTSSTFLQWNGSAFTWAAASTSPAGSNTQIQFNNSGAFGASSSLTWDGSSLTVNSVTVGRGGGAVSTNTAIGGSALGSNTSGGQNTAVGNLAGNAITTQTNATAIGYSAGANISATAIGSQANSSDYAVAIGHLALANNIDAVAIGVQASASGQGSTAVGRYGDAEGPYSVAIGYNSATPIPGNNSIAIGSGTVQTLAGAAYSIVVGSETTSSPFGREIRIGASHDPSVGPGTGFGNILIGYQTNTFTGNPSNSIAIGDSITVMQSNATYMNRFRINPSTGLVGPAYTLTYDSTTHEVYAVTAAPPPPVVPAWFTYQDYSSAFPATINLPTGWSTSYSGPPDILSICGMPGGPWGTPSPGPWAYQGSNPYIGDLYNSSFFNWSALTSPTNINVSSPPANGFAVSFIYGVQNDLANGYFNVLGLLGNYQFSTNGPFYSGFPLVGLAPRYGHAVVFLNGNYATTATAPSGGTIVDKFYDSFMNVTVLFITYNNTAVGNIQAGAIPLFNLPTFTGATSVFWYNFT